MPRLGEKNDSGNSYKPSTLGKGDRNRIAILLKNGDAVVVDEVHYADALSPKRICCRYISKTDRGNVRLVQTTYT